MPTRGADRCGALRGAAVQQKPRRSGRDAIDLDLSERDALTEPGAEGLHRRLLGGEPRGQGLAAACPGGGEFHLS